MVKATLREVESMHINVAMFLSVLPVQICKGRESLEPPRIGLE